MAETNKSYVISPKNKKTITLNAALANCHICTSDPGRGRGFSICSPAVDGLPQTARPLRNSPTRNPTYMPARHVMTSKLLLLKPITDSKSIPLTYVPACGRSRLLCPRSFRCSRLKASADPLPSQRYGKITGKGRLNPRCGSVPRQCRKLCEAIL